jgi:histidinol phosphatase-like enzyme (inositol monophosphatase family)
MNIAMPDHHPSGAVPAELLEAARAVALACADAARPIVRRYFRETIGAEMKGDDSPVTIADREAEQAMRAVITKAFPAHDLLGEEYGSGADAGSDWQWVLDPIDGTRAFITGRPTFGTLIALLHKGRPVLGVLDQPVLGERWIGIEGRRTEFSSPIGGRIGPRALRDLAAAELSCTSPDILSDDAKPRFANLGRQVRRVSWGGDCYAYGLLALGQIDVVAECTMKVWDWAALVPIVAGAGGIMTDWRGRPLDASGDGTVLALGDPALLDTAVAALAPLSSV